MPGTKKQMGLIGADYARAKAGKRAETGMSREELKEWLEDFGRARKMHKRGKGKR